MSPEPAGLPSTAGSLSHGPGDEQQDQSLARRRQVSSRNLGGALAIAFRKGGFDGAFLDLGDETQPIKSGREDLQWHEFFDVILTPNQKLSKSPQETIARDYDMDNGVLRIPVRRAMLYYFYKRLRLDVADRSDDPKEAPVVLSNKSEFQRALKAANA